MVVGSGSPGRRSSYAPRDRSPRRSNVISACVLNHACFPEHRYLDLPGVFHLILDFLGHITREGLGTKVIEIGGADDHPHLTAGLNRVGFLYAVSLRAPGRLAEIASAAATKIASMYFASSSPW